MLFIYFIYLFLDLLSQKHLSVVIKQNIFFFSYT